MTSAWLLLAAGDERQHGGNDGYDDLPDVHYSWDSTVPNHRAVDAGDLIALWDKRELLGASVIEVIETDEDVKTVRRCVVCQRSGLKARKRLRPKWWCYTCKQAYDDTLPIAERVTTYRTRHDAGWVNLEGILTGAQLRALCESPKSQLSLRRLDWEAFAAAVQRQARRPDVLALLERRSGPEGGIPGGHRLVTVRARIGQRQFRESLLRSHGEECAFSGPAPKEALEAAHLYRYANLGAHHMSGGLLMRRDLHRLFDDGDVCVNPESMFIDVSPRLQGYDSYGKLHGQPLRVVVNDRTRAWLREHWQQHR